MHQSILKLDTRNYFGPLLKRRSDFSLSLERLTDPDRHKGIR